MDIVDIDKLLLRHFRYHGRVREAGQLYLHLHYSTNRNKYKFVRIDLPQSTLYFATMGRRPKTNIPPQLSELLAAIAANVRDLRLAAGMTQTELAAQAKISLTTMNEIETKPLRDIRLSTLVAIASVMSVPVVRLLEGSDVNLSSRDHAKLVKAGEEILRITRKLRRSSED